MAVVVLAEMAEEAWARKAGLGENVEVGVAYEGAQNK